MTEKKTPSTLLSRIKKMMQQDEDVGKVAKGAPVLIGACVKWGSRLQSWPGCRDCTDRGCQATTPMPPTPVPTAARAMDTFLEGLMAGAVGVAEARGAKALTASHL